MRPKVRLLGRHFMLCSSFPRCFASPLAVTFSDSFSCRPASGSTPLRAGPCRTSRCTGTALRRALQTLYGGLSGTSAGVAEVGRATALRGADGAVVAEEDIAVATGDTAFLSRAGAIGGQRRKCADRQEEEGDRGEESEFHWRSFRANDGCMLSQARAVRFRERRRLHGLTRALTGLFDGAYKWRHQVMRISVDVAGPNLTHTHRANGLSRGYPGGPFFVPKK